jgi:Right handed beta helix region
LHLFDSVVTQNNATTGGGIGVNSPGAPVTTIIGCLIADNVASAPRPTRPAGGGVAVLEGSLVSIQQSTIARNQSTGGGGVYGAKGSDLTITGTTVTGNTSHSVSTPVGPSAGEGGGLETGGDFTISDSFFVGNAASGEGGGGGIALLVADNGNHTINRTIVSHNSVASGVGGGILASGDAGESWTLQESYVVQNLGGFGVWSQGPVALVLIDTTINGNVGGDLCDGGC